MKIKPGGEEDISKHQARDAAFLEMVNLAGWVALKSLLLQATRHDRLDLNDPQLFQKTVYKEGRVDQALDIIKAVEAGAERAKGVIQ